MPVLCKTAKCILPVGELLLIEAGDLLDVPDKERLVRVLKTQMSWPADKRKSGPCSVQAARSRFRRFW